MTDVAGVFVGGASRRMGGRPKGLLTAPGGVPIVERWCVLARGLGVDVVLVGEAGAYAGIGVEALDDDPPGIGPLGGLVALLRRAKSGRALAFACDMPFVSRELVERLVVTHPGAPILAPRRSGRWEPLCARYDAPRVLPRALAQAATRDHSLQRLLDGAGAMPLLLTAMEENQLHDWDSAADLV